MCLEPKKRGTLSQREHQLSPPLSPPPLPPPPHVDTEVQDRRVPRFRLHLCPKTTRMNFLVPERRTCTHSLPCLEAVPVLGHWVTGFGCLGVALRQTAIPEAAQCSPPLASQRDLLVCCLLQTVHKGDGPGWVGRGQGGVIYKGVEAYLW